MNTVLLRRGLLARLRCVGAAEFFSFIGVVVIVLIARDLVGGVAPISGGWVGDLLVVAFLAASLAVRVAVAIEYVIADDDGVRWRTLFRSSKLPWHRIEAIDIGTMYLLPQRRSDDVLRILTTDGKVLKLRPSAWCESAAQRWLVETLPYRARVGGLGIRDGRSGLTDEVR